MTGFLPGSAAVPAAIANKSATAVYQRQAVAGETPALPGRKVHLSALLQTIRIMFTLKRKL